MCLMNEVMINKLGGGNAEGKTVASFECHEEGFASYDDAIPHDIADLAQQCAKAAAELGADLVEVRGSRVFYTVQQASGMMAVEIQQRLMDLRQQHMDASMYYI